MELLASYSSEESDNETELSSRKSLTVSKSNKQQVLCNIDYFNLEGSDSDEESYIIPKKGQILNSVDLLEASNKLNRKVYGPGLPSDLIESDVELLNPETFTDASCTSGIKTKRTLEYETSVENAYNSKKCRKLHECGVSQLAQKTCVENSDLNGAASQESFDDSDWPEEKSIYYVHPRISDYISSGRHCRIPKQELKLFKAHSCTVSALCWCSLQYSHLLLSASIDSTLKIWDTFRKLPVRVIRDESGIKAAKWTLCGTKVIYGGFGKKAKIFDMKEGKELRSWQLENYVSSIAVHPGAEDVFLVGTKDEILVFDKRNNESTPIRKYCSNCQYVLDIAFIKEGKEFISSTEIVSHDSANRTLMAWDLTTGAIISNQIYHERYTCPSIKAEPSGRNFVAQTNGDYIVKFSADRPYKMENMRYTGHKVSGYGMDCDFSPDGKYLASGDVEGDVYIYTSSYGNLARKLNVHAGVPTIRVCWHPVLYSTLAIGCWDGSIHIWH